MPSPVRFTWESRQDLLDLFALVASGSGEERAELVLRRIHAAIAALADWPSIGRRRDDLDGFPRVFAVWPGPIIYEPQEGDSGIIVWRVVDGRRDFPPLIHAPVR